MKKSNKCPKCESTEIIRIPGMVGAFGSGNNIAVGGTIFSSVKISRYLCGRCGFSEEWVDAASDIQKIRDKYGQGVPSR